MTVVFSEAELEAIEVLADFALEPGTRCPVCHRRHNKPRQPTTPEARKVKAGTLPEERATAVDEGLDALQEFVGADGHSYPRGSLVEALVVLGAQQREQLKAYFESTQSLHRHHRKRRSQGGTDDEPNIMLVTPEQHQWIHENVAKSYELGWLVESWQDPAEVPIRGEWPISEQAT